MRKFQHFVSQSHFLLYSIVIMFRYVLLTIDPQVAAAAEVVACVVELSDVMMMSSYCHSLR